MLCLLFGVGAAPAVTAAEVNPPKREIRAAWLTTVWAIDWPKTMGTGATVAEKQQQELRDIIDKMHAANMNTIFFQIRGFSDAMYNSSYEPWSRYLVGATLENGKRKEPTYDPLAFAVEYAHYLGMELHAWVNPYRYSTSQDTYYTGEDSYAKQHPEWLMSSDQHTVILNPGIPEVRDQIVRVISEVVQNYDIDGVLFDDYFYINGGTKDEQDQTYYEQYNPDNLSRGDWRRQQVNLMVRQVHDAIKAIKPYCRFGISPAGVACTSQSVADKYGVDPAPVSSDWQYNGIYSDPLAWLSEQSIDYISPQIYWAIGSNADYDQLCNWWSQVSNKFGRHFYSSSSLSNLSKLGNQEYVNQVGLNRAYDRNGATGSVFYGLSTGLNSPTFMNHMKENSFTAPALQPNMAWFQPSTDYRVTGLTLTGNLLKWDAPTRNVRYAVYAIPTDSIGKPGILYSSKYLLGMTYTTSMTLEETSEGYSYAVTVVDRFANEMTSVVMGQAMQTITPAELTYPEQNGTPLLPCYFSWQAVDKADSYLFQLAESSSFDTVLYQCEIAEPTFYIGNVTFLEDGKTYYWRVRTRAINAIDTYSEVRAFIGKSFNLISPAMGEEGVSQTPLFVCDSVADPTVTYRFEVASANTFANNKMVFSKETTFPHLQVQEGVLAPSTTYYVRVSARFGSGISAISSIHQFRTLDLPTPVPTIIRPLTGDTIYGTSVEVVWEEQNARGFRVELSTSKSFAPRYTKSKNIEAYTYSCVYEDIEPGDYYLRIKASAAESYTEPSEVQTIVVVSTTDVNYAAQYDFYVANGMIFAEVNMPYSVYAIDGRKMADGMTTSRMTSLPVLPIGYYLLKIGDSVVKFINL